MEFSARSLSVAIAISLALAAPAFAAGPDQTPAGLRAKGLANGAGAAATFRADADTFTAKRVVVDKDGTEHVRLDRSYRGLPVIGGDVVVHSKAGKFESASLSLKTKGRPDVTPTINADDAMVAAGVDFDGTLKNISSKGLVVYARDTTPTLAYEISVVGTNKNGFGDMRYFVDAKNGKVLDSWNLFQSAAAAGTGKSLLMGDIGITTDSISGGYQLLDPTRGNGNVHNGNGANIDNLALESTTPVMTDADNVWGNNSEADVASEASDAHFGIATTWDYYKNTFGRNGIFNDGVGVKSVVNVIFNVQGGGTSGGNAGWYGSRKIMAYGSGTSSWLPVVSIDVAGHEMTHGVTQAVAGLAYSGDAGGLNEATSDIMGTMVEFYANNASDPGDYLIGEKIWRSNPTGTTALRYMFKPSADGRGSYDCYPKKGFRSVDPHYSSGVGNHFFYLLAEGAVSPAGFSYTASQLVCNGDTTVAGIGRDAAQRIWYRALDVYFTSGTSYANARTATLNAAKDLYGSGSTQYNAVARAWSAVSVN